MDDEKNLPGEHSRLEARATKGDAPPGERALSDGILNPVTAPEPGKIGPTGVHLERFVTSDKSAGSIDNAGSNPDGHVRRSGGSPNDPYGGHEQADHELHTADADPVEELVPGGQGAEPSPYSNDLLTRRMGNVGLSRQSFASDVDASAPSAKGSAATGLDPSQAPPKINPTSAEGIHREGMFESGPDLSKPDTVQAGLTDASTPPVTSAYTDSQKPNIPGPEIRAHEARHADGSGQGQEPVERRANNLVFDEETGNFRVADEQLSTGVSSQNQTGEAP